MSTRCEGGTVSFLDTTTVGDTDNYDSPWVAVYYTSDCVDRSYLDEAYTFVIDSLDYAYNSGYISGYTVKKRSIEDWCPCCCNTTVIDQWNNLRDGLLLTHEGDHALIHDCDTDSCEVAEGTNDKPNPWETDGGVVASTDVGNKSLLRVAEDVMHETLHDHCRSGECSNVANMIDESEHDLGVIKEIDGDDCITPLATDSGSERGTCDTRSGSHDAKTTELSLCEMDGMEESAEHTAGLHDCSGCT